MGSRKKQIFEENIEIPDIVQRKADEAFEIIRKERTEFMKEKKVVLEKERHFRQLKIYLR